ncbi:MAG TPA: hypothetical protein VEZ48_07405 [Sphingomonadaceae bacterium]|nr:hypothetical protein [Sphingomonadaceae bacterium]
MRLPFVIIAALVSLFTAGVAEAQRVVVTREQVRRIELRSLRALPVPQPPTRWNEGRGPKCIARSEIVGASVDAQKSVDFILRDRSRHRALLQRSCPALDYYGGFYLKPTEDGKICQDRDAVHARSGGECEIDRFRKLTPAKAR